MVARVTSRAAAGAPARPRRLLSALVLALAAAPLAAQESIPIPPSRDADLGAGATSEQVASGAARDGTGGALRVLDKIDGRVTDLELRDGETAEVGTISVTLGECRYPADNPSGDAYALLSIRNTRDDAAVFEGWMIASAPALNALDHPRYDVWALRCLGAAGGG